MANPRLTCTITVVLMLLNRELLALEEGRIAFSSSRSGTGLDVYTCTLEGTDVRRITYTNWSERHPAWSPDGRFLATSSGRDRNGEIYLSPLDGSQAINLTNHPASDTKPCWSPDGKKIVFASTRDYPKAGTTNVYVMNADGTNQTALTRGERSSTDPDWSPDGTHIVFATERDSTDIVGLPYVNREIYIMNADGSNMRRLTNTPRAFETEPSWSPDGTQIVFVKDENLNRAIYVMNVDGSNTQLLTTLREGGNPRWSPDGSQIIFSRLITGTYYDIFIMNADGSDQRNITNTPSVTEVFPDWFDPDSVTFISPLTGVPVVWGRLKQLGATTVE